MRERDDASLHYPRGIGLTTADALAAIADAIRHPGTWRFFQDHSGADCSRRSASQFKGLMQQIIEQLRLQSMEVSFVHGLAAVRSNLMRDKDIATLGSAIERGIRLPLGSSIRREASIDLRVAEEASTNRCTWGDQRRRHIPGTDQIAVLEYQTNGKWKVISLEDLVQCAGVQPEDHQSARPTEK